jgi:hypothetical protein
MVSFHRRSRPTSISTDDLQPHLIDDDDNATPEKDVVRVVIVFESRDNESESETLPVNADEVTGFHRSPEEKRDQ